MLSKSILFALTLLSWHLTRTCFDTKHCFRAQNNLSVGCLVRQVSVRSWFLYLQVARKSFMQQVQLCISLAVNHVDRVLKDKPERTWFTCKGSQLLPSAALPNSLIGIRSAVGRSATGRFSRGVRQWAVGDLEQIWPGGPADGEEVIQREVGQSAWDGVASVLGLKIWRFERMSHAQAFLHCAWTRHNAAHASGENSQQ